MVIESDPTRFASKRQTILEVLDPIHRSLLLNNSSYEHVNKNTVDTTKHIASHLTNSIDYHPTTKITHATDYSKSKVTEPQKQQQQPVNLIENKHYSDVSYSSTKPDAAYVSDINGLMVLNEGNNFFTDESECIPPCVDERIKNLSEMTKPKKNIRIRILTNKKRIREDEEIPSKTESLKNSTDTSSYEYVETDSEIESPESTEPENTADSVSSCNDHKSNDHSDSHNSDSSSYEDATSSFSASSAPMIHIVQEITERRLVTSIVHVNREKAKSYNRQRCPSKVSPKEKKTKWKNKQKIIDDNVCNEILDQSINWDVMEGNELSDDNHQASHPIDFVRTGVLKAKPKYSERTMGKLMEKRLSRVFQGDHIIQQTLSPNYKLKNSVENSHSTTTKPPAKPPRTFSSSSSKSSTDSVGANTATTMTIEDYHKFSRTNIPQISHGGGWAFNKTRKVTSSDSVGANTATTAAIEDFPKFSRTSISPQISPGGGWMFDRTSKVSAKPTCPTFEEITDNETVKKVGWTSSIPKRDECLHILNMLNSDYQMQGKMTSSNLLPEPQFNIQSYKEDIDQVDSSSRPIRPVRRSKKLDLSMDLNDTMYSTPIKRSNQFLSFSAPNSVNASHSEMEICKKCKLQVIKPSSARRSFGKGAIKRTKSFFKASKNIWTRPKSTKVNKSCKNQHDSDSDCDFDDEQTPTKLKLNATAEFNSNNTPKYEKKTVKTLGLTPDHSSDGNVIESPRRILDKFLTSVKRTPPKKPIRQSILFNDTTRSPSNNEEEIFNFDRIIDSPNSKQNPPPQIIKKGFKLSPRKLFRSSHEKPTELQQTNSYRSFENQPTNDLKVCISEYLREMNEKIDQKQQDNKRCQTLPRCRNRIRTLSTSSDAIDYMPQRVVQIDYHPEPIYSEIIPPPVAPNHIIVNNNPKAIYATVDKTKKQRTTKAMSINDNEIHDANQEYLSKSCNSLTQLDSMDNSLADSILNMLALMKQQRIDEREITEDTQMRTTSDDIDLECVGPQVKNCEIIEQPAMERTTEHFQQSAAKCEDRKISDNTSIETYCTESLCEDVIRGDSVNSNIAAMIDQLENMDLISTINFVEPESDDESLFDEQFCGTEDMEFIKKIDSISPLDDATDAEENTTKESANTISTLHPDSRALKFNRANNNSSTKKCQSPLQSAPSMIEIPDQYMLQLTKQIIFQREIRNQLKNAIEICRTTKEFECSSELVEAERLMLLSAKKEMCAKNELNRIDYEEYGLTNNPAKCGGCITIKKIEFLLKSDEMFDSFFKLFFICVCSYRDQVVVTHAQERVGNKVEFNNLGLNMANLDSSFDIRIEVFVLRLRKTLRKYSHESKYHLNKDSRKSLFINPVKLFSNSSVSPRNSSQDFDESKFRIRGYSIISARTLTSEKFEIVRNVSWPESHAYRSYNTKSLDFTITDQFANMIGPLQIEFISEVCLKDSGLEGFINIAERKTNLKPYWCRLSGCTLGFWNDDIDCGNGKRSILSIDLKKCTNETIQLDEKMFSLDIFNDDIAGGEKNRINHFWFGSNDQYDLILWLTELNRILKFIKDWNI